MSEARPRTTLLRLADLLAGPVRNGYSPVCGEAPTGRWVLGLGALGESGLDLIHVKPAPADDPHVSTTLLKPGDFLISRSNTRDKVGRAALWRGELEDCSYPDLMMRFRIREEVISPEYLEAFLRSAPARRHLERYASGTSGSMVKITKRAILTLPVPMPPLAQQQLIASALSALDSVAEKTVRLALLKRRRRTALFRSMTLEHTRDKRRLRELCVADRGGTLNKGDVAVDGRQPCILYGELHTYYGEVVTDIRSHTNVTTGIETSGGEILMPSASETAEDLATATAVPQAGVLLGSDMIVLRPRAQGQYDPAFLAHCITHLCRQQIAAVAQGQSVVHLYGKDALRIALALPPLERQQAIAELMAVAQKEVDALEALSDAYRRQREGLAETLFRDAGALGRA